MTISAQEVEVKPPPSPEQQSFLDALDEILNGTAPESFLRMSGGPGTGKSFTTALAAHRAAEAGWAVMLVGPTHQAVGVLAAAVPMAYPYEPDAKTGLSAGAIVTATAHKVGQWVQKSRSKGAARGESDPVPENSWLGRSLKLDWIDPPKGVVMLADEISMYTHGMVRALDAVLATVRKAGARTVMVGIGDPFQLVPVRGQAYRLHDDEIEQTPSLLLTRESDVDVRLAVNQRAKHPALRRVVQTYLNHQIVPSPYVEPREARIDDVYRWRTLGDSLWTEWADRVASSAPGDCVALAYTRAMVAFAGDRLHQEIHGEPAGALCADRFMRVQETYSPRGRTLAASSDMVRVVETTDLDAEGIAGAILPPTKGHYAAHHDDTLRVLHEIVGADVAVNGTAPAVTVKVLGDRAGVLRAIPAAVISHGGTPTASETRWHNLQSALGHAAFRAMHQNDTIRRGLASIFYHLADSARLKLETPYAMTSHRSQGSTFKHVLILASGTPGGPVAYATDARTRHSSSYVMLSRASQSLTIAWS